jgi:hypothetical protein
LVDGTKEGTVVAAHDLRAATEQIACVGVALEVGERHGTCRSDCNESKHTATIQSVLTLTRVIIIVF